MAEYNHSISNLLSEHGIGRRELFSIAGVGTAAVVGAAGLADRTSRFLEDMGSRLYDMLKKYDERRSMVTHEQESNFGPENLEAYINATYVNGFPATDGALFQGAKQDSLVGYTKNCAIYWRDPETDSIIMSEVPHFRLDFFRYYLKNGRTMDEIDIKEYGWDEKGQWSQVMAYTTVYDPEKKEMIVYSDQWDEANFKQILEMLKSSLEGSKVPEPQKPNRRRREAKDPYRMAVA